MRAVHPTPCSTLGLVTCALAALLCSTPAAAQSPNPYQLPDRFDRTVCYWIAQNVGRTIAWARWEQDYTEAKTRAAALGQGTPDWVIALVSDWIGDAYAWRATDEQVRTWAEELGNVEDIPAAASLSRYETIAVWMRRIGRDCDARESGA